MYKHRSASYQRRHKVHEIDFQPTAHVGQGDLLPDYSSLDLAACEEERGRLMGERARLEAEILGAKRERNEKLTGGLGHRIQSIEKRLGALGIRIKALRRASSERAFASAVKELCPPELLEKILTRQAEIEALALPGESG